MARPASDRADPRELGWGPALPAVRDLGEDALLQRLRSVAAGPSEVLAVPSGDDAAGWMPAPGRMVLVSTDALVEDVDFRRATQRPHEVGWKAYAINASDLAAMGATPELVVVMLLLPETTPVTVALALQQGIVDAASEHRAQVVGGDISATPSGISIGCTALGTADPDRVLRRSAGRPQDLLLVTGAVGGAAAALARLEAGAPRERVPWVERLLRPRARVGAGAALAAAGVGCAIDCSDGLLIDAGRLAAASGCGAEVWLDHVPLAPGLEALWGTEAGVRALTGGEDFELIAAAPAGLAQAIAAGAGWGADLPPVGVVGRLVARPGLTLLTGPGGTTVPVGGRGGFTHF